MSKSSSKLGRAPGGLFAKGNQLAVKSGVRSNAIVHERSAEIRDELTEHLNEHLPHLAPADRPMVDLAVDMLTKLRLINEYLGATSGGSLVDRRGMPRQASSLYIDLVRQTMNIFRELGIGPRARAGLLDELGLAQNRRQVLATEAQARLRAKVSEPKELPDGNA